MSDTIKIRAEFRKYGKLGITDSVPWSVDDWETGLEFAENYAKRVGAELLSISLED